MTKRDKTTLKGYFTKKNVPVDTNYIDLIDSMGSNATEGPGIDIAGTRVGLGGDSILVYHSDGRPVSEYSTLDSASAAAVSSEVITLPAGIIGGDHILATGVTYQGLDREMSILSGQITLGDGTILANLTLSRSSTDADITNGLGPVGGTARIYNCNIIALSETGNPICVSQNVGGFTELYYCVPVCKKSGVDVNPFALLSYSPPPITTSRTYDITIGTLSASRNADTEVQSAWASDVIYGVDVKAHPRYWDYTNYWVVKEHYNGSWGSGWIVAGAEDYAWHNHTYFDPGHTPTINLIKLTNAAGYSANLEMELILHCYGTGQDPTLYLPPVGDEIKVYACEMAFLSGYPMPGDRSATDALTYPLLHTNDTDSSAIALHHTLGTDPNQAAPGNHSHVAMDSEAIHKNVAGEISTISEKSVPLPTDLVIIEDSSDSNNKKKVQVGNISGGKGPTNYSAGPDLITVSSNGDGVYGINSNGWHNSPVASITINNKTWEVYAFRDNDSKLCIAVRTIPGSFTIHVTSITCVGDDGHYGITAGLDKNGYIHVAYDMHDTALKYRKSTLPINTFAGALTGVLSMLGTNESQVTYPGFINDPSMELYFLFREGDAMSGDLYFYKYNASSTTWEPCAGSSSAGRIFSGKVSSYGVYFITPSFDANFGSGGKMHLFFMRMQGSTHRYFYLSYVAWDGSSFFKSDGSDQEMPMTISNTDDAVRDLTGTVGQPSVINQATYSDSAGHPHVAVSTWDVVGAETIAVLHHIYHNGSSWVDYTFSDINSDTWIPYPILLIDRITDVAYIIYTNLGSGNSYLRCLTSRPRDFTHWDKAILYPHETDLDHNEADYQPKYDVAEWERSKRLMMPLEILPVGGVDAIIYWLEYILSGWSLTDALLYPELHANDINASPTSIHHTLGTGANQAATGNHLHTGVYSPVGHTHPSSDITDFYDIVKGLIYLSSGEVCMADGVSSPPEPITNETEDDWCYGG